MSKAYFCSLGFDTTSIVRLIGEKGLGVGDSVTIVTTTQSHPRAEAAIKAIKEFTENINPRSALSVIRLNETKIQESILQLTARIMEERQRGSKIIVDVSGGPKTLSIALYLAAALIGVEEIYLTSEVTGERVQLPPLPANSVLTRKQALILGLLPATLQELSDRLSLSKPAVSRILARMREKGLVEYREKKFQATELGRLLLHASTLSRESDLSSP